MKVYLVRTNDKIFLCNKEPKKCEVNGEVHWDFLGATPITTNIFHLMSIGIQPERLPPPNEFLLVDIN